MKRIVHVQMVSLALWTGLSLSFGLAPSESPFATGTTALSGQVRFRTEYDQKALRDTVANKAYFYTQMRSRLGYVATPSEKITAKLEIQDTRLMGSEPPSLVSNPATSSLGNSKGVDLIQGYVTITEGEWTLALGRQKLSLGSGRFLSTLEWSNTSRAFDGLAFNHASGSNNLTGLLYLVRDSAEKVVDDRLLLTGLYFNQKLGNNHQVDAMVFYDQARLTSKYSGLTAENYDLVYLGERATGNLGRFTYEEEFIWQGGEIRAGRDLSSAAFQLATRLGAKFGSIKVNVGLDIMSGDEDVSDNDATAYRANYYFAHAYYGWMDYFTANPAYGVMDLRLDGDFGFLPGSTGAPRVAVKPQYHFYLPESAPSGLDGSYGQEFDLEVHLGLYPKTNIVLGAGFFLAGEGAVALPAAALGPNQDYKPGYFLYLMPTFSF